MNYEPQPLEVFEILEEFGKQTTKAKRIEVLNKYGNVPAFKDVLRGIFDDSLEFLLPEGKPPYTPNIPESVPSTLLKKHKEFGYFVKGGVDQPQYKRENIFIRLLESIHPQDAEVVLSMVNKKSPVKFLTKNLIEETFPNLIVK
jgi:hypothetical protein